MKYALRGCVLAFAIGTYIVVMQFAAAHGNPENIKPIKITSPFPADELAAKGTFLYGAIYFDCDSDGNLFVSNANEGNILCFDAQGKFLATIGRKGQGPGELSYPQNILAAKDFIIVQDIGNQKMQLFDKKGKPIDNFRIYKTYSNMVFEKGQGLIYAAPMLNNPGEKLVDVLNLRGELIRSFGIPMEFKRKSSTLNEVNLACTEDGNLLAAFAFFPIIRKYTKDGNLLMEIRINYDMMKDKEKKNIVNYRKSLIDRANPSFYGVINAIRALRDKIYVLSLYPSKTILELDANFSIQSVYLDKEENDYFAIDFIPRELGGKLSFYVLQIMPDNIIDIFTQY